MAKLIGGDRLLDFLKARGAVEVRGVNWFMGVASRNGEGIVDERAEYRTLDGEWTQLLPVLDGGVCVTVIGCEKGDDS